MNRITLITLTTDFGVADSYVGTMKGVMLGIVPDACLVDISHEIAPQNVRQAAYVLYTAYPFFPSHTVHLVVVDPGVGSARRSIGLRTPRGSFIGPDNGVFSYVIASEPVEALVELADPRYHLSQVSHTFHGRDIFAPAAAHLAACVPITEFGPPVLDPITFPLPRLDIAGRDVTGEVLHIDHFGNVVTSIGRLFWDRDDLLLKPAFRETRDEEQVRFQADEVVVMAMEKKLSSICRTYAEVGPGEVLTLVGSGGHLEIAVRQGSAAQELGLRLGDTVVLRLR